MGAKARDGSKKKGGQPKRELAPVKLSEAQREVEALYSKALERGDDKAIQRLEGLVGQKHSGAACLALAKVHLQQAVVAELGSPPGSPISPQVVELLLRALRVAMEGVEAHNSLQCAFLAGPLAVACHACLGSPGDSTQLLHRLAAGVGTDPKSTLKEIQRSMKDPETVAGRVGAARQWAHPQEESLPEDRRKLEWDGLETVAGYTMRAGTHIAMCVVHSLVVLAEQGDVPAGLAFLKKPMILLTWLANDGPQLLRPADHARLMEHLKRSQMEQIGIASMKRRVQDESRAFSDTMAPRILGGSATDPKRKQLEERNRKQLAEKNLAALKAKAARIFCYLRRRLSEECPGGAEEKAEGGEQWAVQVECLLAPRLRALLSIRLDELQAMLAPAALKGKQKAEAKEAQEMAEYLQLLLEWGALRRPRLRFKFPDPPSAQEGEVTADVDLGADVDKLLLTLAARDAKGVSQQWAHALSEMWPLGMDNVLAAAYGLGFVDKQMSPTMTTHYVIDLDSWRPRSLGDTAAHVSSEDIASVLSHLHAPEEKARSITMADGKDSEQAEATAADQAAAASGASTGGAADSVAAGEGSRSQAGGSGSLVGDQPLGPATPQSAGSLAVATPQSVPEAAGEEGQFDSLDKYLDGCLLGDAIAIEIASGPAGAASEAGTTQELQLPTGSIQPESEVLLRPTAVGWALLGVAAAHRSGQLSRMRLLEVHRTLVNGPMEDVLRAWQGHGGVAAAANAAKRVAASLAGSPSREELPGSCALPCMYPATQQVLDVGQGLILDLCLAEALVGRGRDTEEEGAGAGGSGSDVQKGGSSGGRDGGMAGNGVSGSMGVNGGDSCGGSCDTGREASSSGNGAGVGSSSSSSSSQEQRTTLAELWQQLQVEEEDVQGPVLQAWTQRVKRRAVELVHEGLAVLAARGRLTALRVSALADFLLGQHEATMQELGDRDPCPARQRILSKIRGRRLNPSPQERMQDFRVQELAAEAQDLVGMVGFLPLKAVVRSLTFVCVLVYMSFTCPADMWPEIQALYAGIHLDPTHECLGEVVSSSSSSSSGSGSAPGIASSGEAGAAGGQGARSSAAAAAPANVAITDTLCIPSQNLNTLLHWMPPAGGHSALQGRERMIEAAAASVAASLMSVRAPPCGAQAQPAVAGTSSGRSISAGSSKQLEPSSGSNKQSEEERAMAAACKSLGLDWNAACEASLPSHQVSRERLRSAQRLLNLAGTISQIADKVHSFINVELRIGRLMLRELVKVLEHGQIDASEVLLTFVKKQGGLKGTMAQSYRVGELLNALNKCFEAVEPYHLAKATRAEEEACVKELAKQGLSAERRESLQKHAAQAKQVADEHFQELQVCVVSITESLKIVDGQLECVDRVWEQAFDAVAKVLKGWALEAPLRRQLLERSSGDPEQNARLASLAEDEVEREGKRVMLQAIGNMIQSLEGQIDEMEDQVKVAHHFREAMYFRTRGLLSEVRAQCYVDLVPTLMAHVATVVLPSRWEQELQESKRAESRAAEEVLLQLMLEEEESASKREQDTQKKQAAAGKKKAKKAAKKATQAAAATATAESSEPAATDAAVGAPSAAAPASVEVPADSQQGAGEGENQGQAPAEGRDDSEAGPARNAEAEELVVAASRAGEAAELRSPQPAEVVAGEPGKQPQQQTESSASGSEQQQDESSTAGEDDAGWQQVGSSKGGDSHQSGWRQVGGSKAGNQPGRQQVGGSQAGWGGQQAGRTSNAPPRSPVTQRPTSTASPTTTKPKGRARVVWWSGDWECICGKVLGIRDWCNACNHPPPCRDYLMGTCPREPGECWNPHPTLDLPTQLPPPGFNVKKQAVFPPGQQAQRAQQQDMRIVSWLGHWVCRCGRRLSEGKPCRACVQDPPCSLWLQGRCSTANCPLPHPPFSMDEDPIPLERTTRPVVRLWPGAPKYTRPARPTHAAAQQRPQLRSGAAGAQQAAQQEAQPAQQAAQQPQQAAQPAQQPLPAWVAAARKGSAAGGQPVGAPLEVGAEVGGGALASEQEAVKEASAAVSPPSAAGKEEGDAEEAELNSMLMALGVGQEPGKDADASLSWGGTTMVTTVVTTVVTNTACVGPGSDAIRWGGVNSTWSTVTNTASAGPGTKAICWSGSDSTWRSPAAPAEAGVFPPALAPAMEPASPAATGLSNEAGEYNCFLNVIIQCLWHCAEFRRQVASWPEAVRQSDAIVCALADLFAALEAEEMKRGAAGGLLDSPMPSSPSVASPSTQQQQRSVVNPNPLREALSALPGELFRVGEMSDASEVLLALYDHINASTTSSASLAASLGAAEQQAQQAQQQQQRDVGALDAVFGLGVREYVHCGVCGKDTHANRYTQYFYNTQATALRLVKLGHGTEAHMAQLLHIIEQQTLKSCDTDEGGCDVRNAVVHVLEHAPRVFTLQLAWESQQEDAEDIAATLEAVDEQVDLAEVYRGLALGQDVYRLRSMVCYYGAHYQAFVLLPELESWVMIDDTRVSNIGGWADVLRKCELGRIQPSVLFYEAE